MTYSAILSECGRYRYRLDRELSDTGPSICVVMVNPSTADGIEKDATIRKLDGFGKRLGWRRYTVVNLFAFRATDVNALRSEQYPVGPNNWFHTLESFMRADSVVVAWGANNKLPRHLREQWSIPVNAATILGIPLFCWGVCADGHPKHPVMLGYDTPLIEWGKP